MNFKEGLELIESVQKEIHKGIVGQENFIKGLLIGILSNGHILIEGLPGLAKTRAVNLLSKICDLEFKRIQFTPDMLPQDIMGTRIYLHQEQKFILQKGPIFANFILADEINRAPAKVQSALLEAMQEKQVTIGKETLKLDLPFLVFATQNPIEQEGTYPLPEAQLDRFLLKLIVDYPKIEEEIEIIDMVIKEVKLPDVSKVLNKEQIFELQEITKNIYTEKKIYQYIVQIIDATRNPSRYPLKFENYIEYGASPRGSISLMISAKANAFLNKRDYVIAQDVKDVAYNVLRHRIIRTYHAEAEGIKVENIIQKILETIPVP